MAIISAYYLIAVCVLVFCAYTHKLFKYYTAFKAAASCGFIAVLLYCADAYGLYFIILLFAMLGCLAGDILLGLANNLHKYFGRLFCAGLVIFALSHILFTAAFGLFGVFNWVTAALIAVSVLFTYGASRLKGFRFSKMKLPAIIYSGFVGLACAGGINAFLTQKTQSTLFMALGAALFLLSDCLILFLYFTVKRPRKIIRVLNLITYYAGLFLIALSA